MIVGVDRRRSLPPVPIHVLTGFLGAGKTTLLNALLRDPRLSATAVVVNEYGAIGIDHHLVEGADGDLLILATGCICCAARGDVTEALQRLLDMRAAGRLAFDRIVIETTGLADPGPVINAILLAPSVAAGSRVGALVTVVDGVFGADTLAEIEEARVQVALADRIVLTKTELLGDAWRSAAASLMTRVRELNTDAPVGLAAEAIASGPALFHQHVVAKPGTVARGVLADQPRSMPSLHDSHPRHHAPAADVLGACVLRAGPVECTTFEAFLAVLQHQAGSRLLRVKGLIAVREDPDRPVVVHVVRHLMHPVHRLPAWPDEDRGTRLAAITRGFSPSIVGALWDGFFGPPEVDRADAQALSRSLGDLGGLFA